MHVVQSAIDILHACLPDSHAKKACRKLVCELDGVDRGVIR